MGILRKDLRMIRWVVERDEVRTSSQLLGVIECDIEKLKNQFSTKTDY